MKEVLRTASISLAESLRLALEAEEIPVLVSNENLGGLPPAAISVMVAEDADYDRGLAILNGLEQATGQRPHPGRRLLRLLIILVVGAFLVLCVNVVWP